jgi:hypothetical protein
LAVAVAAWLGELALTTPDDIEEQPVLERIIVV